MVHFQIQVINAEVPSGVLPGHDARPYVVGPEVAPNIWVAIGDLKYTTHENVGGVGGTKTSCWRSNDLEHVRQTLL